MAHSTRETGVRCFGRWKAGGSACEWWCPPVFERPNESARRCFFSLSPPLLVEEKVEEMVSLLGMSRPRPGKVASPLVPEAKEMARLPLREDEPSRTGEVLGEEERALESRSVVSWAMSGLGERKKCFEGTAG